jgi:UDP-N-acetylglucosamine 1-carboxyvinyltransferase
MKSFEVIGGSKLNGEIIPQGAKNEALQVICAVLLTSEEVVISNIPDIVDVRLLIEILSDMGVEVKQISEDTYSFKAAHTIIDRLYDADFHRKANRLRGSVMIAGPLLSRFKRSVLQGPEEIKLAGGGWIRISSDLKSWGPWRNMTRTKVTSDCLPHH